ncbi:short chain dehydrogenase/reductase SDR [Phaeosphaeria sp. MPI-PUGE-AT-0046c]|nr:short chain dehydrogenase/reductase SDR [Phaeosphaeria sp. MPI-PUGE-AT-0046c]
MVDDTSTMRRTVLLTGANGSLGVTMVDYILRQYPDLTLIVTVRDDSDGDSSTLELRRILSQHSNATAIVRKLDLSSLEEVVAFSKDLQNEISNGKIPLLKAIICNAMSWKLSGGPAYSNDGYEMAMAVNHLAHFALSLRLLGSMDLQHGRIVFLGSEAHWPLRAGLSKGFPTHVPEDMDLLVHPDPDEKSQEMGRGFQRYGVSKLVIIMVMYELSRKLQQGKDTKSVRAITVDPLGLLDSRTFLRSHVPRHIQIFAMVATYILPLLRLFMPSLSSVHQAAKPVVDLAVADEYAGQEGYFEGNAKIESSPESQNIEVQKKLWEETVNWCGLEAQDTVIEL